MPETLSDDGESVETQVPLKVPDAGLAGTLARAEFDTHVATAKQYPRSIKHAIDNILSLATYDEQTAMESIYALPRGGKPIKGPSIRLAETIAQQWGNNRVDAKVIAIDRANKVIVAEGTFHDLETNAATRSVVQRRISDRRGMLFNDDMIVVTGNAACSIARRNAILAGVPKAIWRRAYEAAEKVVAGDIKTLAERRENALRAFAAFGVKPEQIFGALGIGGIDDITLEHIPILLGMHSALKNGEATVEEMFDPRRAGKPFEVVRNPLKDDEVKAEAKPEAKAETPKEEENRINPETGEVTEGPAGEATAEDEIQRAYERGKQWRAQGKPRKAVPGELRQDDRLVRAWQVGFDGAEMPRELL